MSDLIDREEAIKAVYDKDIGMLTQWDIGRNNGIDYAIKQLEKLPSAQPERRWIPCSERLPETDKFVLVSLSGRYKNIGFEHSCEIADYADGEWFINAYPFMMAETANYLIEAWMPLPELYKGETE